MWKQDKTTFVGKYYSVKDAICLPRPVQEPRIPIWVGGMTGPKILGVIARHADGWNMMRVTTIDEYRLGLRKLRDACLRVGRDPAEIKTSVAISGSVEECRDKLRKFEEEGLDLAILRVPFGEIPKYLKDLHY